MSTYWKEHNIMYFHYPKTGGTTFRDALKKALGPYNVYGNVHCTYQEVCNITNQTFDNTYKVMTIRNPWQRFYSHWKDQKDSNQKRGYPYTFEEYILLCPKTKRSNFTVTPFTKRMKIHWNRNVMQHCKDKNGNIVIDKFIPIERLQLGFDEICKKFKVKSFNIGKKNVSGPQDNYQVHYTDEMREIIAEHCQKEIEYFNYIF